MTTSLPWPFHLVRTLFRTLRFRLMLWNAFVVLLTATATLVGLREGVRFALLHETDLLLQEDVREIALALGDPAANPTDLQESLNWKARGHAQHGWFAQFLDETGRVTWSSENAGPALQAGGQWPLIEGEWSATIGNGRPSQDPGVIRFRNAQRLVQRRLDDSHGTVRWIRVGQSLQPLAADMARIDRLVAVAGGIVLVAAPLCGYWLAGRATRALGHLTETAARLRPSRLEERLPIRGTGDELDRLAGTVNGLLDRIATYLETKRDFLANAAHELRTPLAAIRSSVEVALASERTAEEYQHLLSDVIGEVAALEWLVNQLLLLSETEVERLEVGRELVPLEQLVRQSVEMFGGVAESRGLHLMQRTVPLAVDGNPRHLRQVVNNLLENAVKFTPAGGRIDVELRRSADGQRAELLVRDTGIGIPPEELPRIFGRFYRGDRARSREGATQGTGLGLSICEAVVQAHRGSIHVDSQPGRGSTFTVLLPLARG